MIGWIISVAFYNPCHQHHRSAWPQYKMHHQSQPNKIKIRLYQLFMQQQKIFYLSFITNQMECFSFKSECVVRVENGKMCRQLQLRKTKVRLYNLFIKQQNTFQPPFITSFMGSEAFKRRLFHSVANRLIKVTVMF